MSSVITSAQQFPPPIQMNIKGPALTRQGVTEKYRSFCEKLSLLPLTVDEENVSGDFTLDYGRRGHREIHRDEERGLSFVTSHWVGDPGTPYEDCFGGHIDLDEVPEAAPDQPQSVRVNHIVINGEGFETVKCKTADGQWTAKTRFIKQVPDASGPDPVYRPVLVELDPNLDFYSLSRGEFHSLGPRDGAKFWFDGRGRFQHLSRVGQFHSTFGTGEHTEGEGGARKTHKWKHVKRGSVGITEHSVLSHGDQMMSVADVPRGYRGEVPPDFGQSRNGTCFTSFTQAK
jgi:hypothetical protein